MSVRKMSATTISIGVMVGALYFLFLFAVDTLSVGVLERFDEMFVQQHVLVGVNEMILRSCGFLIALTGIVDVILRGENSIAVLSALSVPFLVGICIAILLATPIDVYYFSAGAIILLLLGVYRSFYKMTKNMCGTGIKLTSFVKGLKTGEHKAAKNQSVHALDYYTSLILSTILAAAYYILLIVFATYIIVNRSMLLGI